MPLISFFLELNLFDNLPNFPKNILSYLKIRTVSEISFKFLVLTIAFVYSCEVKWSELAQSCPTLCDPMDSSPPGSSIHGILQARILEWVAISFSRGTSRPRDRTRVSHLACRGFTLWATGEAPALYRPPLKQLPYSILITDLLFL